MRKIFLFTAVVVALICGIANSAPVPKAPNSLTREQVVATWAYSWGNWENGIISFSADGTYSAQHIPGGETTYAGTWELEGSTVTIKECTYNFATGEFRGGPIVYRFQFKAGDYPNLKGLSNENTQVALSNPVR